MFSIAVRLHVPIWVRSMPRFFDNYAIDISSKFFPSATLALKSGKWFFCFVILGHLFHKSIHLNNWSETLRPPLRASVRPSASRSRVEADMPAASALARDSAFSAAVRQNWSAALWCKFFPRRGGRRGACRPSQGLGSAAPAYDMGRLSVCSAVGSVAGMI